MADPGTLGDMGCVTHGFIPYALRTFAAKYPDKRQRMAKGAEALKMVNHYESIMSARHLADYDTTSSGDYDPRMVVLHLGRVDRLLKFAASIK
ncbi:hypothetical protein DCD74_02470 [Lysobacter oculi]|uniref:Uncharacterized protein n=2 Tax=Solilutibacter oculi TaxID=2698682 RepID=A0A344J3U8_9GAMM|nr:hypothetical protein DCD74_02470 [Lysobacter oculi]